VREAVENSTQGFLDTLREKLVEKEVDSETIDTVFECIAELSGDSSEPKVKRHLGANKAPAKPASKAKIVSTVEGDEKENLKVKHDGQEVIVCLNYGPKSHALFGDFGKTHLKFKNDYLLKSKFIKVGRKLAFGFGWVIMDKSKISEVT